MRILVTGWFSFEQMGASAGDLIARDLACDWLKRANIEFDVALAAPFTGGIDWRNADPQAYDYVLFVCGPFGNGPPLLEFLDRFRGKLLGLNLTMLQPLEEWNPFELLIERDSSRTANPDIVFAAPARRAPVVGLVQIDAQPEYRDDLRNSAHGAFQRLIDSREMAVVPIDTRLDQNSTGLRSAAEVESLISRMDVVLTTRLHGAVLALKSGVPVIAVDAVAGGAKVLRQCRTLGWQWIFTADSVTDLQLSRAFEHCLTETARRDAADCARRAAHAVELLGQQLLEWLQEHNTGPAEFKGR